MVYNPPFRTVCDDRMETVWRSSSRIHAGMIKVAREPRLTERYGLMGRGMRRSIDADHWGDENERPLQQQRLFLLGLQVLTRSALVRFSRLGLLVQLFTRFGQQIRAGFFRTEVGQFRGKGAVCSRAPTVSIASWSDSKLQWRLLAMLGCSLHSFFPFLVFSIL